MKKRALAIVMAGLMAASMSSVCAYAEAEEKTEGFTLVFQMDIGSYSVHRW